jgi:uncharacterized protein with NAD-binding domain and iron-sulfur cluster
MSRLKIAVLGGGMSGLAAAFELTKTEALRARHEVSVYQMGWRLGGKLASSRDEAARNLEHGLHVWFGFYENAFRLLQEVYAVTPPPPESGIHAWTDAFKPTSLGGAGVSVDGKWSFVPVTWPVQGGYPGDGTDIHLVWDALTHMLGWLGEALTELTHGTKTPTVASPDPALLREALAPGQDGGGIGDPHTDRLAGSSHFSIADAFHAAHLWAGSLGGGSVTRHHEAIVELVGEADRQVRARPSGSDPRWILIGEAIHLCAAVTRGVLADLLLKNQPLESIDDQDFRAWIIGHGADPKLAAESSLLRVLYDTVFQYRDGDFAFPSYSAGSALGMMLRMSVTYKGAIMYLLQTGFGEGVISPVYNALLEAGVAVRFFHKVTGLELSADGARIERLRIDRQALIKDGDYRPTVRIGGLDCWPTQPFWDQLEGGEALKAAGVNFESAWCVQPPAQRLCLQAGRDFDAVVLALPPGAYKPRDGDPGPCAELIAQGGAFADYINAIALTPTLAVQLWSDRTLEQLGWTLGPIATAAGVHPLDAWADMSQVIRLEKPRADGPVSLYYLCGTMASTLYRQPPDDAGAPARGEEEARRLAVEWLNDAARDIWPNAATETGFRWEVLSDPGGRVGEARLDAQYIRANVDPCECCSISLAGDSRYRLYPDQTGFTNLFLAGEGARQGFNASAVEAAVMSGMAASRAICGEPTKIIGYDFLTGKPF